MCYTTQMGASVRVGVAVVFIAALLGGCSSGTSDVPKSFKELQARVVANAPDGFVAQSPGVYDTGPTDLAKAVKDDGAPNAGKLLRSEGFVRGYQRIWKGPEHAGIIVFLYQFHSTAGARQHFARSTREFHTKPPRGTHKFAVPFLPATQAVGVSASDESGAGAGIEFTSGVFSVQIACEGPTLPGLQSRVLAIAKDQYNRL